MYHYPAVYWDQCLLSLTFAKSVSKLQVVLNSVGKCLIEAHKTMRKALDDQCSGRARCYVWFSKWSNVNWSSFRTSNDAYRRCSCDKNQRNCALWWTFDCSRNRGRLQHYIVPDRKTWNAPRCSKIRPSADVARPDTNNRVTMRWELLDHENDDKTFIHEANNYWR